MQSPLEFIQANPLTFARRGSVVASYRIKNGRHHGPYYRLAYTENGRQRSLYLGRSETLAQQARDLIDQLQQPRNDRREEARAERLRQANILRAKRHWQQTLRAYGLYTRGWVVRGFRAFGIPRIDKAPPRYRQNQSSVDQLAVPSTSKNHDSACPHTSKPPNRPASSPPQHLRYRQNRRPVDQLSRPAVTQSRGSYFPYQPQRPNSPSANPARHARYRQNRHSVDQLRPGLSSRPRGPPTVQQRKTCLLMSALPMTVSHGQRAADPALPGPGFARNRDHWIHRNQ